MRTQGFFELGFSVVAVPGVGGADFAGVFRDKDSKGRG